MVPLHDACFEGDTELVKLDDLIKFDEEQLGRMAAAQVQAQLLNVLKVEGQEPDKKHFYKEWLVHHSAKLAATARAARQLVRLAGFARERALKLRSSDPHSADDHQVLFGRLQLAAAACIHKDWSGKDRRRSDAHHLLRSDDGRKALEHALQIKAKELLAQPVVQGYIEVAWRGERTPEPKPDEHGPATWAEWLLSKQARHEAAV